MVILSKPALYCMHAWLPMNVGGMRRKCIFQPRYDPFSHTAGLTFSVKKEMHNLLLTAANQCKFIHMKYMYVLYTFSGAT